MRTMLLFFLLLWGVIVSAQITVSVAENLPTTGAKPNGTFIGHVIATDEDIVHGDYLTYTIVGGNTNSAYRFGTSLSVKDRTGNLYVNNTRAIYRNNHCVYNSFRLTVKVTDKFGAYAKAIITVNCNAGTLSYSEPRPVRDAIYNIFR